MLYTSQQMQFDPKVVKVHQDLGLTKRSNMQCRISLFCSCINSCTPFQKLCHYLQVAILRCQMKGIQANLQIHIEQQVMSVTALKIHSLIAIWIIHVVLQNGLQTGLHPEHNQSACNCHLEFLSVTNIPITLHPYTMKYFLVVQKL